MPQTPMYRFRVCVHGRPAEVVLGETYSVVGTDVSTLDIAPTDLGSGLAVGFEDALAQLQNALRMIVEPDGSFVWTGNEPVDWMVEGQLHDQGPRLNHVELSGCCTADHFDQLLRSLGWPQQPVVFQLVQQAVFVEEEDFRRVARAAGDN